MHQLGVGPIILGCIQPGRIVKYLNAWSTYKASLPSEHSIFCLEEKNKLQDKHFPFTLSSDYTSWKLYIRDHFLSVVKRDHVFNGVSIYYQKTPIIQPYSQGFPIRRKGTASSTYKRKWKEVS